GHHRHRGCRSGAGVGAAARAGATRDAPGGHRTAPGQPWLCRAGDGPGDRAAGAAGLVRRRRQPGAAVVRGDATDAADGLGVGAGAGLCAALRDHRRRQRRGRAGTHPRLAGPGRARPGARARGHAATRPPAAAAPGAGRGRTAGVRGCDEGAAGDPAAAAAEFRNAGHVVVRGRGPRRLRGRGGRRAADRAGRAAAGDPAGAHRPDLRARGHGAMSAQMLAVREIRVSCPAAAGPRVVVDGLSLALARGEIGCLLGASGCGKTTVLRAIAGFEPLQAGTVALDDRLLSSAAQMLAPERRGVGMMFQDYALFPHLDVARNVGFGLSRQPRREREARVAEVLELVGLPDRAGAWPHELSGGQQQRVALARALAPSPSLLLLDEPFSNLDIDTREHLAAELRTILRRTGTTALLVTHDQAEAFAMADAIGVMDQGRILQWADAATLYARPADPFVAGFIGRGCVLAAAALGLPDGGRVLLRPDRLLVDPQGPIHALVLAVSFRGPGRVAQLRLDGGETVEADLPEDAAPASGTTLRLRLADAALVRFP